MDWQHKKRQILHLKIASRGSDYSYLIYAHNVRELLPSLVTPEISFVLYLPHADIYHPVEIPVFLYS